MANDKVKLEYKGGCKELDFEHALQILRNDKNNIFKVVGKHEFVNNELIIKRGSRGGKKSTKPKSGKKGGRVPKSSKNTD